ncbi:TNT domain-containing protein [Saccharopolyspora sp. K220]|uniref:TNT domain-containing protein n=1 Tax=Saccharopolyspora soli TaxID=2926618 RepID=UPI001F5943DF|nr:TNT domain-containing protein [Saccharopolyspora soli]MCI2417116.1 TNT domain-containing protein [Saccharopolyspora soli]
MILGTPIAETFGLVDGEYRLLHHLEGDGVHVEGSGPVPLDQVTAVLFAQQDEACSVHPQFPARAAFGHLPDRSAQFRDLTRTLQDAVASALPEGWREAQVNCTALGTRIEITATVTTESEHPWIPTQDVVDALRRLRNVAYHPETGAWTTASFRINEAGADFRTGYDAPQWTRADDQRAYYEELRYFPRSEAPEWLFEAAWSHFANNRDTAAQPEPVRMAQVFDVHVDDRAAAYRPALPWAEKRMVLDYLHGGEILLTAHGTSTDEVDPQRPPEVPKQFHTDGTWVWPLALAYYLEVHDIAPPRDFLDHIRRTGHRPPEVVADRAAAEAKALVLGADADHLEAFKPAEAIELARGFIGAMGMSTRFYSFEAAFEGGWSMLRDADGWWSVFCVDEGEIRNKSRFPDPFAAAAQLIGAMALTRTRFLRAPDEPLQDFECPFAPLPGEAPLAAYDSKFLVDLRVGDEVDRFGEPTGNTVFVAGTTLPQRSVPPQQPPGDYRRYRVLSGFQVVSGVVKPDFGQVGGGTAFVLPNDLQTLVAEGWLAEV